MSETGITTAVLKGSNVPKDDALTQGDLEQVMGYDGLVNCGVEHVSPGREVTRSLPGSLATSPHD